MFLGVIHVPTPSAAHFGGFPSLLASTLLTQNDQIWRVDIWGASTFGQYPRPFFNGAEPQCSPIFGVSLYLCLHPFHSTTKFGIVTCMGRSVLGVSHTNCISHKMGCAVCQRQLSFMI